MKSLHVCWQQPVPIVYLLAPRQDLEGELEVEGIGKFRGQYVLDKRGIYVVYHWSQQDRIVFDIGKTYDQTFERRLRQHLDRDSYLNIILDVHGPDVANDTMVKVGILKDKASQKRIDDIESLLIYCHPSKFNKRSTKSFRSTIPFKLINSGEFFPPFASTYDSLSVSEYLG